MIYRSKEFFLINSIRADNSKYLYPEKQHFYSHAMHLEEVSKITAATERICNVTNHNSPKV